MRTCTSGMNTSAVATTTATAAAATTTTTTTFAFHLTSLSFPETTPG